MAQTGNVIALPSKAAASLKKIIETPNLAAVPDIDATLATIAQTVIDEYDIDKSSRKGWELGIAEAVKLSMLVAEEKAYPWPKAANVKYPLLTVAALQFNARAYPAIVQGNEVVKCQTWGGDPQGLKAARAERVQDHMSYQLLSEQPEWEEDTDKLLVSLPIVGSMFRKVYYDPSLGRNVTRLIFPDSIVVNYRAKSLVEVPRLTEELYLYPYEIQERIRSGRFIDFDYKNATPEPDDASVFNDADKDAPHLFLEQHRLLDIDGDGYPEPYIVTVHKGSQKVCRIVANFDEDSVLMDGQGKVTAIRKTEYFVHYQFLPSPDGSFYGWGFGWLLKGISETINSTLSMMMDAGHLANVQGGLVSSNLGIKDKKITLAPGEWKVIQNSMPMKDAIMPITYPGPNPVLFELLGMLIESGKEVAAIKDVLTGEGQGKNASPTTTMALIEQGLQVFTSIYKRIHRSLKAELGILAKLNRKHVTPERYNQFLDGEEMFDPALDYDIRDMDINPVSDPATVSKMQKMGKAQFIYETSKENPVIDPAAATLRMLEAAGIEEPEKLMKQPDPAQQELAARGAQAEVAQMEADAQLKTAQAQEIMARGEVASIETGMKAEESAANHEMAAQKQQHEIDIKEREFELRQQEMEIRWEELDLKFQQAEQAFEQAKNAPQENPDAKAEAEATKLNIEYDRMELQEQMEAMKLAHAKEIEQMRIDAAKETAAMANMKMTKDEKGKPVEDKTDKELLKATKELVAATNATKELDVKYDKEGRIVSAQIKVKS